MYQQTKDFLLIATAVFLIGFFFGALTVIRISENEQSNTAKRITQEDAPCCVSEVR